MRWYIDGIEFKPVNAQDIGFKGNLQGNPEFAELSVDRVVIEGQAAEIITQHINTLGIFEGIPVKVEIESYSLELFIDLLDNLKITDANSYPGTYKYECSIKRRKGLETFRDKAAGTSFRLVQKTHPIPVFDVPFVIVRDNQGELLISLLIATFVLTKEAIEATKRLVEETAELIQVSITDPVPPAGAVIKIGGIIKQALVVIAVLAYVVLLSLAIKSLIEQIIEIIFPKVRNLKAAKVRDLMQRGCQAVGYGFESTLMNELFGLTILPVPATPKKKSWWEQLQSAIDEPYNLGYPTDQDSTPTVGSLFDEMATIFNAEYKVVDGVVRFETENFFAGQANVELNRNLNVQGEFRNTYTPNSFEAWKRYLLTYTKDISDSNTYDVVTGSGIEMSTEPITVVNPDLVSVKGLEEIRFPFAQGRRKNEFSWLEERAREIAQAADKLTAAFGLSTNLTAKIDKRIGVLQISNPFFGVTKLMWTVGGRQPANFVQFIGTKAIYDKYHFSRQYKNNAKAIFEGMPCEFDPALFGQFFENRFVTLSTGETAEILDYNFEPENRIMTVTYVIPANYGDNTKTIQIYAD
jgi:hypothetical protein